MPSASSAAAARRRARARPKARPRAVRLRRGKLRLRLDRLGRVALLVVFAVVAILYVRQGLALLSTHSQAQQQRAVVQRLARANARLAAQQRSLNDPATIERDARALG